MSLAPPLAVRQPYDQKLLRSRAIFRWRADSLKLDALSGHTPVFTRSSTAAGTDSEGNAVTYPQNFPCWSWANSRPEVLTGAGGSGDIWYYPIDRAIGEWTALLRFRQEGSVGSTGTGWFYWGPASETGARVWVEAQSGDYSARMHNGSAEVGSTLTVPSPPGDNDQVLVRVEMYLDGSNYRVRISQDVNDGGEVTATESSAQAFTAFGASSRIYLGSLGGLNPMDVGLREVIVARGRQLTQAQLLDVF